MALDPHSPYDMPSVGLPQEQEFHLWDHISVVLKRLPLAVGIFVAVILLGILYSLTRTPTYRAVTRVLVNPTGIDLTRVEGVLEPVTSSAIDFIPTQAKLVTSKPVLLKVIQRLKLMDAPDFAAAKDPVRMLAERITVTQIRGTRLLDIAAVDEDPKRAANIANATVRAYMESAREKRIGVSRDGLVQLRAKADELRQKLQDSTDIIQAFLSTNNITSFASAQRLVEDRMRGINENLWRSEPARFALKAQVAAADEAIRTGRPIDTLPSVMANPIVSGLLIEQAKLGAAAAEMQFRLGENHPQIKNTEVQLQALKTQIGLLARSVLDSLRIAHRQSEEENLLLHAAMRDQETEIERFNQLATSYELLRQNKDSIAEALNRLVKRIEEIDINMMGGGQGENISIEVEAEPPVERFSPRHFRNLIVAGLLAILLSVGTCYFLDYMDTSIRNESELQRLFAAPILGSIPAGEVKDAEFGPDLIAAKDPAHPIAEAFRLLRSSLMQACGGKIPRSIAITSAMPGDGKTITSINLALAHAAAGRKVLLVDADLRKARLHNVFDLKRAPGLSDLLAGTISMDNFQNCIQKTEFKGLMFLPAGQPPHKPAELLDSPAFRELSERLCAEYDFVIFDTPPSGQLVDAILIARHADGVIVVVRMQSTPRGAARFLADNLRASGANVIGITANNADVPPLAHYGRTYRYYRAYGIHPDDAT